LIRYYQDVLRLIERHGQQADENEQYFWLKPVIYTRGVFDITFSWHDTWVEAETALDNLSATSEGSLYEDFEQGWHFESFAEGARLFLRDSDPDFNKEHVCIVTDRRAFSEQIPTVRERMTRVLQELRTTFGRDYWSGR
jgi:hypothetical protein